MMQRWLCGRSAGSQLPAAPGWRRGGGREPPAAGGHRTGGAQGNGGGRDTPLHRSWSSASPDRCRGQLAPARPTVPRASRDGLVLRPFGGGDLRAWLRGGDAASRRGQPRTRLSRARSRRACALPAHVGLLAPRGPAPVLLSRVSRAAPQAPVSPTALPRSPPLCHRPARRVGSTARRQNRTKTRGEPTRRLAHAPGAGDPLRRKSRGGKHGTDPRFPRPPPAVPRTCRARPNGHTGRPLRRPGATAGGRGAPRD